LAAGVSVVTYQQATASKQSIELALLPIKSGRDLVEAAAKLSREADAQLAQLSGGKVARLTVIPLRKLVGKHAETTEKARSVLGATHVLEAALESDAGKIVLHAALTDARSAVKMKDWRVEYASGDVKYASMALAGFVTGTLRLPPLANTATVNAAAKQDYWAGLWYIRQNSTLDAALPLLERAIAADPDSPLPYAALAEAEGLEHYLTKDQVWLDRTRESVRQAEGRNPDVGPVHRVEGYLNYAAGFYEQAVAEFERAIELQPSDATAYIWLGKAYEDNNQINQALTAFRKAVEVEPNYFGTYQRLGAFYLQRSNFSEGAKYHKRAVELAPYEPNLHYNLAVAYVDLGRFAEAESELRDSIGLKGTMGALYKLGQVSMYQSKDREAIPYLQGALKLNLPPGSVFLRYYALMYLGIAYRRLDLRAEAKDANRRGLQMAEADMARNPRDGYVRGFLGYFSAALGDRSRAESELAQALRLMPDDSDTRWRAALAYEALGLRDKTLELLRTSTAEQLADINRWPDLADLHQNSRFLELLTSHHIR
jgi:tetratricopeptide (TPR) repeat protein